jgi:hypothetical protein
MEVRYTRVTALPTGGFNSKVPTLACIARV